MGNYINRDSELATLRSEEFGDSTVRVCTRKVGNTAVVDLYEYSPENARPLAKAKLTAIVRREGKTHVVKPSAVSAPIADATMVRDRNRLDSNGNVITDRIRVRQMTYVVRSR